MEIKSIPAEKVLDSSLALMKDGYNFIRKRCDAHQSEIFKTRVMLQPAICISGHEAAALVYNNDYFLRNGAGPKRMQKPLFGEKGVQTLNESIHRQRKEMFMSLMEPEQLSKLAQITREQCCVAASQWESEKLVSLLDEAQKIMCIVACQWAGVPVKPEDIPRRSQEFGAMVDAFAGVGLRHRKGKVARRSSERWIKNLILQVRKGRLSTAPGSVAYTIAFYKENGKLLDLKVATVELINILRPIVAVANYIVFAALAMYKYPATKLKVKNGEKLYLDWFIQEVRRFYPFTPFIGARVRDNFSWNGYEFPKGYLVLLDVYGTDHDPKKWELPDEFWPERFRNFKQGFFDFIPLGAGEWVTLEAIKAAVKFLATNLDYHVPDQDLTIDLSRMPTFPRSRFIIMNVKVWKPANQPV